MTRDSIGAAAWEISVQRDVDDVNCLQYTCKPVYE